MLLQDHKNWYLKKLAKIGGYHVPLSSYRYNDNSSCSKAQKFLIIVIIKFHSQNHLPETPADQYTPNITPKPQPKFIDKNPPNFPCPRTA